MNILEQLHHAFNAFLAETFSLAPEQTKSIQFSLNVEESKQQFGDISSNAAMVLAKQLQKAPREIAQQIITFFKNPAIERMEIAGPGFLNIFLTQATFHELAKAVSANKQQFFKPSHLDKQSYSIEYVSANPTGPLHIGHGRGGIIGDVLGNVLRFLGHNVTKEFYINDAGSQIQKLGNSLYIRCQQELGQEVVLPEDAYQGEYLIELAQHLIKEHGADVLKKSPEFFANYAKNYMLDEIKKTLQDYGIHFDVWFSEKTLHESGAITQALQLLIDNGFTYELDGALWFTSKQFGDDKDRVLRKSDGTLTYIAADIAYMQNKLARGADRLIYIIGQDHHSYVVRLKGILQALGHNPTLLDVILYQLVSLKQTGELVRMSKRAGTGVTLEDLIKTVGTDVARFFYLNRKADAHLDFDIDLALKKTDENPVYYIQYAYVRTKSILEKAARETSFGTITLDDAHALGKEEQLLIKKMISLKDLLANIGDNYQTHLLTYYVLELAQLFHSYYAKHRVIDESNPKISRGRLFLVTLLRETLGTGLSLMGLHLPEQM